jgi:enoyl-CoA hydratase/carnithine racemase
MTHAPLELVVDGQLATIWLNRPEKRNAVTAAMWETLPTLLATVDDDPSIRVLAVRGRGEHFCAGADITELGRALAADTDELPYRSINARAEDALAGIGLPTVAVIDGSCVGGGVQLALACDIRIATDRARFGVTPGKLGITYPARSLERLVATVGPETARRLLYTAELVDAREASSLGLVDSVVDAGGLDEALDALTSALLATSAVTQVATKEMVDAIVRTGSVPRSLSDHWEGRSAAHGDVAEGLAAFASRRPPSFGPRPERSGLRPPAPPGGAATPPAAAS